MGDEDLQKRKEDWLNKVKAEGKMKNPTEDHRLGLKALQNPTRRSILKSIPEDGVVYEDVKSKFNLDNMQAKMHLNFLEEALYIEKVENEDNCRYCLTPRGEAYLENADYS